MKKFSLLISTILLFGLLISCANNEPSQTSDTDMIATIVAGTLSAIPTSISTPTVIAVTQTTNTPIVPPTPNLNLDDFLNKVLIGENDSYSVYMINSSSGDAPEKTGEIIIYDKNNNFIYKIIGSYTFFASTLVTNDGKGEYILLSDSSYTSRAATVISLADKKQAVNRFCTTASGKAGDHLFWNDYVIFNNCDHFQNRPWGVGEAPSITAINLKTGTETAIAKSDLTHQYVVKQIEGNTLHYFETYVANEVDWQNQDKQIINESTYDLTLLGNN